MCKLEIEFPESVRNGLLKAMFAKAMCPSPAEDEDWICDLCKEHFETNVCPMRISVNGHEICDWDIRNFAGNIYEKMKIQP